MAVVFIKRTGSLQGIDKVESHIKYVGFRSKEINEKGFFDREDNNVDYKAFLDRVKKNPALKHHKSIKVHKLVFSLKQDDYIAYLRSGKDYKDLIRYTLNEYENKHNVKLDWIANIHNVEGHPHVHVIIKGVSDLKGERGYNRIRFNKDDFKDMKFDFDKEFEIKAQYKFHERDEIKTAINDIGKGLERLLNSIKRDVQKEQYKSQVEKDRDLYKELKRKQKERER